LLTPDKAPHSGHRVYIHRDILTLQKIGSFKFLGYTLAQIQQMIREPYFDSSLNDTLQLQKKALEEKKSRIEIVLKAVNRAMTLLAEERDVDSSALLSLIQSIQAEQEQQEWLQQYISQDAVNQLYNKPDNEME
jgi:DNA-binding transcriptional MerR regulator